MADGELNLTINFQNVKLVKEKLDALAAENATLRQLISNLKEDAEIWYEHATNPCSDYQTLCDCDRDHRALMKELGEK